MREPTSELSRSEAEEYLRNLLELQGVELTIADSSAGRQRFKMSKSVKLYARDLLPVRAHIRVEDAELSGAIERGSTFATVYDLDAIQVVDWAIFAVNVNAVDSQLTSQLANDLHPFRVAATREEPTIDEAPVRAVPAPVEFASDDNNETNVQWIRLRDGQDGFGWWFAASTITVRRPDELPIVVHRDRILSVVDAGTEFQFVTATSITSVSVFDVDSIVVANALAEWLPPSVTIERGKPLPQTRKSAAQSGIQFVAPIPVATPPPPLVIPNVPPLPQATPPLPPAVNKPGVRTGAADTVRAVAFGLSAVAGAGMLAMEQLMLAEGCFAIAVLLAGDLLNDHARARRK